MAGVMNQESTFLFLLEVRSTSASLRIFLERRKTASQAGVWGAKILLKPRIPKAKTLNSELQTRPLKT